MTCLCVANHSPAIGELIQHHHVVPLSWGGPNTPGNKVDLCPNAHELVHRILNEGVRRKAWPDWAYLQHFNWWIRGIARRGWDTYTDTAGKIPTGYTLREAPHA